MPLQPGASGKTMARESADSARKYAAAFHSNVPQRPTAKSESYGGRPLGPYSYHPLPPVWTIDPLRQTFTFASIQPKTPPTNPGLTKDLDFLDRAATPGASEPSSRVLPWTQQAEARPQTSFQPRVNDLVYETDFGSKRCLSTAMLHSARKYAVPFTSGDARFRTKSDTTGPVVGPGMYETAGPTIVVRDAKRASAVFKALGPSSPFNSPFKPLGQPGPPDFIEDSLLLSQARAWTTRGCAYSTRERFPKVRKRWDAG